MNKDTLTAIREDFNKLSKEMEEKHGVSFKLGTIRHDDLTFRATVEGKLLETESGQSTEQAEFEKYCILYGFEKSDYKRQIDLQGEVYEFIGFNPSKPKNNVKIKSVKSGKTFITNDKTIKNCILLEKARQNRDSK